MNYTLEGINNRPTITEEWISDLKDRLMEINQSKQQKIKIKK